MAFKRAYRLVAGPVGLSQLGPLSGGQKAAGIAGIPGSAISAATTTTGILVGLQALDLSALRATFVIKTKIGKPAHADIHVYNASQSTRNFLAATGVVGVSLSAGHVDDGMSQLFVGEIISGPTHMDGPNYVTRLETTDKTTAMRSAIVKIPIPANATVYSVVVKILSAINSNAKTYKTAPLGEGHTTKLLTSKLPTLWPRGGLLQGFALNCLDDVCKSAGLNWSIVQGAFLFTLSANGKGHGNPTLLTDTSGLVYSPGNDGKGILNFRTLIMPGISLDRIVKLESKFVNGFYKIIEADFHGDTHGQDWTIHCKGSPVKT